VAAAAPNHIWFEQMTFQNFYGFPIWIYEGEVGSTLNPYASYIWIEHNLFTNTRREAIRSYGVAGHVRITDNDFWNYGNLGGGNWDAIYWADTLASTCATTSLTQDWRITGNHFYNTAGETKFSTELYGGTMSCSIVDGLVYSGNYHDGEGYGGGIGISAGSMNSTITANVWRNCTANNDRCGIENWAQHGTVANNTINGGSIQLYPSSGATTSSDVSVTGNSVTNSEDAGVGTSPILLTTGSSGSGVTTGFTIAGNTLDLGGSACTANDSNITVGATASGATESQINISSNTIFVCSGGGGTGIRIFTTAGATTSNVTINGNNIRGSGGSSESGVADFSTDTRDSDIRVHNNHIISTVVPLNFSLPSTQWDQWGNDTSATGQGFNSANGYQAGGLTVINSSGQVLSQTTSPWAPYVRNTITSAVSFGQWSPPQAEIAVQIEYSVETAPVGCSVAPYLDLYDYTLASQVTGTAVNISGATGSSGAIAIVLPAGHIYAAHVVAGTGCGTNPSNVQATVQLRNTAGVQTRAAFNAAAVSANFGNFIGSGETITQIDVSPQVAPLACSPFPTVALYDYTASATVSGTTVTLASAALFNTSGVISVGTTYGHNYGWQFTQGSGCGTNAAVPMVTMQYTGGYETWNGYAHLSPANGTTVSFGSFTPQVNLFVAGISFSLETVSSGCSVAPSAQLYDLTASATVSGISVNVTGAQTWQGNLAAYLIAGHQYEAQLVGGTGCSVTPANPDFSVQFNVNAGNLAANNNLADVQSAATARANLGAQSSLTFPLAPNLGGVGAMTSAPFYLRNFGNGSDGALNVTSGTTNVSGEKWYSSVSISSGAILADTSAGSPLIIRSTGTCTIAGTISVSPNTGSGGGNSLSTTTIGGGSGGGGGGGAAGGTTGSGVNVLGGGTAGASSGGGGGNGSTTAAASFRPLLSTGLIWPAFTSNQYGGAGGGAGGSSGPNGGKGAGILILVCPTINFTGTVDASGVAGATSTGNNVGASGGGGGGFVVMSAQTYSANSGTINVAGGSGGGCSSFTGCGTGGNGASGNSIQAVIQ
jgi:hypothetical protein